MFFIATFIYASSTLQETYAINPISARTILRQSNEIHQQTSFNSNHTTTSYLKKKKIYETIENIWMHVDEPVTLSNNPDDIEENYIQQPLDHFSMHSHSFKSKTVNTLNQRFFYSSRYVSSSNTSRSFAFLCVGGEGPSLTKNVLFDSVHCTGDMLELAKRLYEVRLFQWNDYLVSFTKLCMLYT